MNSIFWLNDSCLQVCHPVTYSESLLSYIMQTKDLIFQYFYKTVCIMCDVELFVYLFVQEN